MGHPIRLELTREGLLTIRPLEEPRREILVYKLFAYKLYIQTPPKEPNQTKLENILSFPENLTFSLKYDQINLFTNV